MPLLLLARHNAVEFFRARNVFSFFVAAAAPRNHQAGKLRRECSFNCDELVLKLKIFSAARLCASVSVEEMNVKFLLLLLLVVLSLEKKSLSYRYGSGMIYAEKSHNAAQLAWLEKNPRQFNKFIISI
jgi:hypothetical protein